ncbi:MAG TPA: hypoxanthine phosphoribosyltransferase [Candidatus Acidoferrales bacterium]
MSPRKKKNVRVFLRHSEIQKKVREMADQINRDFEGERIHMIAILKGAFVFLADLLRNLKVEVSVDFIGTSSYGDGTRPTGEVRLTKDLDSTIEGLNVILVEDILDTGLTLNYLLRLLQARRPKVLKVAALLDKPSRRIKEVKADYIGFEIPNAFVVGYGLDFGEKYRNLKDICVLDSVEP